MLAIAQINYQEKHEASKDDYHFQIADVKSLRYKRGESTYWTFDKFKEILEASSDLDYTFKLILE